MGIQFEIGILEGCTENSNLIRLEIEKMEKEK